MKIERGIFQREDREGYWVQIVIGGRRRTFKAKTLGQARTLYHRLQTEKVDKRLNPEKYRATAPRNGPCNKAVSKTITVRIKN